MGVNDNLKDLSRFNRLNIYQKKEIITKFCNELNLDIPEPCKYISFISHHYQNPNSPLYKKPTYIPLPGKKEWRKSKKKEKEFVESPKNKYWYENPNNIRSKRTKKKKTTPNISLADFAHTFYGSDEWRTLRLKVLRHYGCVCMKCNAKEVMMHVDHIKPRSKYPELELEFNNLQVLCKKCNEEKSDKHCIDYRPKRLIPLT